MRSATFWQLSARMDANACAAALRRLRCRGGRDLGGDVDEHHGLGAAGEGVLQQRGELGVAVGHVGGVRGQCGHDGAQGGQGAVDVARLHQPLPRRLAAPHPLAPCAGAPCPLRSPVAPFSPHCVNVAALQQHALRHPMNDALPCQQQLQHLQGLTVQSLSSSAPVAMAGQSGPRLARGPCFPTQHLRCVMVRAPRGLGRVASRLHECRAAVTGRDAQQCPPARSMRCRQPWEEVPSREDAPSTTTVSTVWLRLERAFMRVSAVARAAVPRAITASTSAELPTSTCPATAAPAHSPCDVEAHRGCEGGTSLHATASQVCRPIDHAARQGASKDY